MDERQPSAEEKERQHRETDKAPGYRKVSEKAQREAAEEREKTKGYD